MYALTEAVRNIRREPSMSSVSMVTIAVTLVVLGVFGAVTAAANGFLDRVRGSEEINVYLKDSLSDADMLALDAFIDTMPEVGGTRIVSKENAAAEFEHRFGPGLLEGLEENPLPRTIVISMADGQRNADAMARVASRISGAKGVEAVEYGWEWMSRLDILFVVFVAIESILVALAVGACMLVIANTITLTIIARRDAIDIMRLVGATDGYIRRPFYLEGMLQGLTAGTLAFGILYGVWFWLSRAVPGLETYLFTFTLPGRIAEARELLGLAVIPLGAITGLVGSWFAVRRVF